MAQPNWRWCTNCQGLFFAGSATLGVCPAGGKPHVDTGSGNYNLSIVGDNDPLVGQSATVEFSSTGTVTVPVIQPGVTGEGSGVGAIGVSGNGTGGGRGVVGVSDTNAGVEGDSSTTSGIGVYGSATGGGRGVVGVSDTSAGVEGDSSTTSGIGVYGRATGGARGVVGVSDTNTGIEGDSTSGYGVYGTSQTGTAGYFQGNVEVTGTVTVGGDVVLTNSDCAEDFDVGPSETIEPGMVLIVGDDGLLQPSRQAYDSRVAGVVSGACEFRPGITLGRQETGGPRVPVALVGKVYCMVDAQYGPVRVGDLLTSSPTVGHAMAVRDRIMASGSVLGKALKPLSTGCSLIPILVCLQ
jgi:hypothetical protein